MNADLMVLGVLTLAIRMLALNDLRGDAVALPAMVAPLPFTGVVSMGENLAGVGGGGFGLLDWIHSGLGPDRLSLRGGGGTLEAGHQSSCPHAGHRARPKPWHRTPHSRYRRKSRSTNPGTPGSSSSPSRLSANQVSKCSRTTACNTVRSGWRGRYRPGVVRAA